MPDATIQLRSRIVRRILISLATRWAGDPQRFRHVLQNRGPTFVKIGQFLALRPDLIPQEYCDELMHLLDQTHPVSWVRARRVIEDDLGDYRRIFAWINPNPLATGSLAQTHAARLRNGRSVVVKIQRPNLATRIRQDLRRLNIFARMLELSRVETPFRPQRVVQELSHWLEQEMDFELEARNQARLYRLAVSAAAVRIPRVYRRFTTRHVLVSEQLMGVPLTEILAAVESANRRERAWLSRLDMDVTRLAKNLLYSTLEQMFEYQFFHADVHPGNLLAIPGDLVGYVDFGLCAELETHVSRNQRAYLVAAYRRDLRAMFAALLELLAPSARPDIAGLRRDFFRASRTLFEDLPAWPRRRAAGGTPPPITRWLVATMRAARVHGFEVPARLLAMYRALLTAETVAHRLAPGTDLQAVGLRFFAAHARTPAPTQLMDCIGDWARVLVTEA